MSARPQTLSTFSPPVVQPSGLSSATWEKIKFRVPNLAWCALGVSILTLGFCVYLFTYQQILLGRMDHLTFEVGIYKAQIQSLTSEDHTMRIQSLDVRLDRIDATLSAILQEHPSPEHEAIPANMAPAPARRSR